MGIDYGFKIRDLLGSEGAEVASPPAIAVAQTVAADGDLEANVRQHVALCEVAAPASPAIILFPELSLTGYLIERAGEMAIELTDPRLAPLRAAAAKHGSIIIAGAPLRRSGRIYLVGLIFHPGGLLDVYAKRRLGAFGPGAAVDGVVPPGEHTVFTPGSSDVLIPWGPREAAIAICADIADPEHAARAAAQRASGYLASMFVIPSEYEADAERLANRAEDHGMIVAMANHGGRTGGLTAAGRSAIWDGKGHCIGQLDAEGAGVLVARPTRSGWEAERMAVPSAAGVS